LSLLDTVLLLCAGVAAGLSASIAGLASLFSYPALLSVGLPPVAANVTNTVALVGSGAGSAWGSRPELVGQARRLRRLGAVAVAGGLAGAGLLLATPGDTFALVVPWLIGFASLMILVRPRPRFLRTLHHGGDSAGLTVGIFLVAVYGGYFGAAAGVLILALLMAASDVPLAQSNAVKNIVLALANGVAALTFVLVAPVAWSAAVPLGVGALLGGRIGPVVVRHSNAVVLRAIIGVGGLGLALKLGLDHYG
jgi:uncharacterized membrane protein YfcA